MFLALVHLAKNGETGIQLCVGFDFTLFGDLIYLGLQTAFDTDFVRLIDCGVIVTNIMKYSTSIVSFLQTSILLGLFVE